MNISEIFGHNTTREEFPDLSTRFHKAVDKYTGGNNRSACNNSMELCCCESYIAFKQICKKCWKTFSKEEQEEIKQHIIILKLKGQLNEF